MRCQGIGKVWGRFKAKIMVEKEGEREQKRRRRRRNDSSKRGENRGGIKGIEIALVKKRKKKEVNIIRIDVWRCVELTVVKMCGGVSWWMFG